MSAPSASQQTGAPPEICSCCSVRRLNAEWPASSFLRWSLLRRRVLFPATVLHRPVSSLPPALVPRAWAQRGIYFRAKAAAPPSAASSTLPVRFQLERARSFTPGDKLSPRTILLLHIEFQASSSHPRVRYGPPSSSSSCMKTHNESAAFLFLQEACFPCYHLLFSLLSSFQLSLLEPPASLAFLKVV